MTHQNNLNLFYYLVTFLKDIIENIYFKSIFQQKNRNYKNMCKLDGGLT